MEPGIATLFLAPSIGDEREKGCPWCIAASQQVNVSKFDNILLCYWLMVAFINVQYFV